MKKVKILPREKDLKEKWSKKNRLVTVNNQQYSFDTEERRKRFERLQFDSENEYRIYQEYRNEWYRRAVEFKPGKAPLAVTIELVSFCNLNCPMCYTRTEEFQRSIVGKNRILPWKIVKNIIDESKSIGVYSLLMSWRGESSLYRSFDVNGNVIDFGDVLLYARKKGILEITSLTNGHFPGKRIMEKIVDAQPNWISFSIDGLYDIYNKIRTPKGSDKSYNAFKMVVSNIEFIINTREKLGYKKPRIRTNTIYPAIAKNPKEYYDFMVNLGVDWITVNEILDFRGDEIPEEDIIENWACQYPFQRLTVSSSGLIFPCTGAHNEEDDLVIGRYKGSPLKVVFNEKGEEIIRSYREVTISEAWNSEKINYIREIHKSNKRKTIKTCRYCRHGAKKHGVEWIPPDWDMEKMEWKEGAKWRE